MNINGAYKKNNTYDAIVVGSGISGGWAAKELCDNGLKTLILERGRPVKHREDYPTATLHPWEEKNAGRIPQDELERNPIIARCYAYNNNTEHFFLKDEEHPYIQEKPFDWIRAYVEGGKSLLWARGGQRWSKYDFEGPARDGFGIEWPITYDELAPWYSHVEHFVGWSGNKDGHEHLPDGDFLPPFEMNCVEKDMKSRIEAAFPGRYMVQGRCAHLTEVRDIHREQGRGLCLARNLCYRGCPYGAYFSSNSSTLPWAERTGNLTKRTHSVVHSIIHDDEKGRATGVRVVDAETKEMTEYYAKVIFVNAACLNSNLIMLNSTSNRYPNGLGNDSGTLGRYVGFHNYRGRLGATVEGYEDSYFFGRRPTGPIMPPFRNVFQQDNVDFQGKYLVSTGANRSGWGHVINSDVIGSELKKQAATPGSWNVYMSISGETIPKYDNRVSLSEDETDDWGIPQLITDVDYDDNDEKMLEDFLEQGQEMLDAAGCKNIWTSDSKQAPGLDIHEMGGARMGKDPGNSVLNKWNQVHTCKNVFVTDGACMTSFSIQNPSLMFMALTARAANYAAEEIKKGNL
ncbi:MAG: GMC family oxidoreductase [Balneolaceae bacterium]|nr:GMC family oxidoreductase [Balneolaceae bacterium]MCH8548912.1 GMC family oxidoreductase [Balneolaceae bacterium]